MKRQRKPKEDQVNNHAEVFYVRYFDANWDEIPGLREKVSRCEAIMSVAMWLSARDRDKNDPQLLVYSVFHNAVYVTIEEEGVPPNVEKEREKECNANRRSDT